jgi:inhibitor of cysteine peptidase
MTKRFHGMFLLFLTLGLSMAGMVGCNTNKLQLTEKDNGSQITLHAGEKMEIVLPGNPSTGYNWEIQTMDTAILEKVGDTEFTSDNQGLVGAGGKLILTFEAKKIGNTSLELTYLRPWELNVDPLQKFTLQVTVE